MGSACSKRARQVDVDSLAADSQLEDTVQSLAWQKMENDSHEHSVCLVSDLQDNELKVFEIGDGQVLVVKEKNEVYAMGTKCTHYGAPLKTGIFCDGKIYCPWHGACFSAVTGDVEEFPALNPIPKYPVRVDARTNEVKVKLNTLSPVDVFTDQSWTALCRRKPSNMETVAIIGSGAAGHSCAETLRQEGFTGRVIMLTKEKYLPYDRPKLSKVMNLDGAKLALRSEEYYKRGDIEIIQNVIVEGVDVEGKFLLLNNQSTLFFNQLVIATGGRPRPLPCPGTHLANVCMLRTPDDANHIAQVAAGNRVVIVGTSFIAMEVAAFLADKADTVTVIGRSSAPFSQVFGPLIGKRLQELFEEKGVRFRLGMEVAELHGDENGKLSEVELTCGDSLSADLLVTGLGVVPCTDFLRGSEIVLDNRGYVPVDEFLMTNCQDIYAAGDIASFPLWREQDGEPQVNIGHWQMALHHGRTAALRIMGKARPIHDTTVPFFWSSMFGKSIRYCGHANSFDDIIIHGDLDKLQFAAFYCKQHLVKAVATLNFDPLAIQFSALLGKGKKLFKLDVVDDPRSWVGKLQDD